MMWLIVPGAALLVTVILLLGLPLRISRDPDREGAQDGEASIAYDRTSRWPIFAIGRAIVLRALRDSRPERVLTDIGCGPGYLTAAISRKFPRLNIVGLDIVPDMVSIARSNWAHHRYRRLHFIVADAESLPLPDNSVDVVVSSLSLHHLADPARAIREAHRVLIPGGHLLIFDLRRDSPRFFYYMLVLIQRFCVPEVVRRANGSVGSLWASYTAPEVKAMLARLPFEKTRVDARPGWLLARAVKQ